jgi:uncharacterized protein YndB with AHSA1/START domain
MPNADAVLQDDRGRTVLRFERTLDHPPDLVWRYLTEAADLHGWHPSPFELEPTVGGAVRYLSADGAAFGEGEVTEYDPPRVLAYTWGEDHLRWELEPRDHGCLLVLTHTFDDHFKAARDAAGWDLCLDALVAKLSGFEPGRHDDWQALNRAYEAKFGIPPEKATPPPG